MGVEQFKTNEDNISCNMEEDSKPTEVSGMEEDSEPTKDSGMEEDSKPTEVSGTENVLQNNKKRFACHLCDKSYTFKSAFVKHYLVHADKKYQILNTSLKRGDGTCKRKRKSKKSLNAVYDDLDESHCENEIKSELNEADHSDQENKLVISEASKGKKRKFPRGNNEFKSAVENKNIKTKEECHICGQLVAPKMLRRHLKIHTDVQLQDCDECEMRFTTRKMLKAHKRTHKNFIRCEECDIKFKIEEFENHNCTPGEKSRNCVCKICGKTFACMYEIKRHMRIHTNEKPYSCGECNRRFTQKSNCDKHVRSHFKDPNETIEKRFFCTLCFRAFGYLQHLKRHILIHTDERPHVCNVCQKGFKHKHHMLLHMNIHTEEKEYKCEKCDEAFKSQSTYHAHKRKHRENSIFCPVCNKGFCIDSLYQKHFATHVNIKPYSCNICDRKFAKIFSLKRHYILHTQKNNVMNDIDDQDEDGNDFEKDNLESEEKMKKISVKSASKNTYYTCKICQKNYVYKKNYDQHFLKCAGKMLKNNFNNSYTQDKGLESSDDSQKIHRLSDSNNPEMSDEEEEIIVKIANCNEENIVKMSDYEEENNLEMSDCEENNPGMSDWEEENNPVMSDCEEENLEMADCEEENLEMADCEEENLEMADCEEENLEMADCEEENNPEMSDCEEENNAETSNEKENLEMSDCEVKNNPETQCLEEENSPEVLDSEVEHYLAISDCEEEHYLETEEENCPETSDCEKESGRKISEKKNELTKKCQILIITEM